MTMGERTMGALARGDALLDDRVDPLFFKVYRTRAPATRTVYPIRIGAPRRCANQSIGASPAAEGITGRRRYGARSGSK